jgi:hypothetical protein
MYALNHAAWTHIWRGNYGIANAQADELAAVANEKDALRWKAAAPLFKGWLFALTGEASKAVETMNSAIVAWRSTGSTLVLPLLLPHLARAYAELGQSDAISREELVVRRINPPTCSSRCELPPSAPPRPHVILPNQVDLPPQPPVSLVARLHSLDPQRAIAPGRHGEVMVDGRSVQPSN